MAWTKGQSGNPKGRPPKKRALTDLLEKTGKQKVQMPDGSTLPANKVLASRIWGGLRDGSITFPDGRTMFLDAAQYLALARMVFNQVDGPPRAEVDLDVGNGKLVFNIGVVEEMPERSDSSDD